MSPVVEFISNEKSIGLKSLAESAHSIWNY